MVLVDENLYKVGSAVIRTTNYFKSDTENDLKEGIQHVIARIICSRESNETTTYYTN